MKRIFFILFICLGFLSGNAQKNSFYFYWGWNGSHYTRSNIHFTGEHYDFTLSNVKAHDRQSKFGFNPYFNPKYFSIPQYNFRLGYFLKDNCDISFGIDHLKYVMTATQTVTIDGYIDVANSEYNGKYSGESFVIQPDFLTFEHTDGLNYINVELRHNYIFLKRRNIKLSSVLGTGAGVLLPRTNTRLLQNDRHDEFHLSGFGTSAVLGGKAIFFNTAFIQTELKGGYYNMPSIRTTQNPLDHASQSFFSVYYNIVVGCQINLKGK